MRIVEQLKELIKIQGGSVDGIRTVGEAVKVLTEVTNKKNSTPAPAPRQTHNKSRYDEE
jgi:hypothetical protein